MRQMEGPEADSGHLGVPQMDGGLGRGILEEELDETDLFIYEDDGSSIATGIGSDDRTNVSEKRGEKDFFLDDEGIIYAKRFADKMQHHMNARESKTALDKIREAFEGRYSKHAKKEKMVVGAVLASLVISTHTDWASTMLRGRLAPYLLSYANIEKVDSSPSSTNTRFERFVSLCAIYALLNVGYVKRCTNDLLLSNVVSKFYDFIVYNRPISIDVSDKDAVWLNSFCKYGKKDHEINRNLLGKTVETNGTRPTAIHVISLDVMHYISTCTIRWPSQIARFRFFLFRCLRVYCRKLRIA